MDADLDLLRGIRMDPDLKARWVAALRSGEYTQIIGVLRRRSYEGDNSWGYCALGVLADVYDPAGWDDIRYGTSQFSLSDEICPVEGQNVVSRRNDSMFSFEALADLIERYF